MGETDWRETERVEANQQPGWGGDQLLLPRVGVDHMTHVVDIIHVNVAIRIAHGNAAAVVGPLDAVQRRPAFLNGDADLRHLRGTRNNGQARGACGALGAMNMAKKQQQA